MRNDSEILLALEELHNDIQGRIYDGANFNPGTLMALEKAKTALENNKRNPRRVEFVVFYRENMSDNNCIQTESPNLDLYVDGNRFNLKLGNFNGDSEKRRGIHIISDSLELKIEKTYLNACSIWLEK